MLDKLKEFKAKYEEIGLKMSDPEVIADQKQFVKLSKDHKELEPLVEACDQYEGLLGNMEEAQKIISGDSDDDFVEMARQELDQYTHEKQALEEHIKFLLIPKDPQDSRNAILEIRAGTGGDEAGIFAGDLYRMYSKYLEQKGWKVEMISRTEATQGGFKEIICNVLGQNVYGTLKYESGVHRVQRVPQTESQGRVHTSAASVAVLPEAEEVDVELKDSDIRRDTFCASGPGGQSVNTTYSAVRLVHEPTGIVVTCQDEKSQHKNLAKAMKVLRTRIYEIEQQKYQDEIASQRKTMVSTGDRSAKIRTYNYAQGRVTDHRINLTLYNLQNIINGDLEEIIDKLRTAENAEKLRESVGA